MQESQPTKFYTVASNIGGSRVKNWLHVTCLAPRILRTRRFLENLCTLDYIYYVAVHVHYCDQTISITVTTQQHTIEQILPICKTDIAIRLMFTESKDKLLQR
jgi:hypothetical protein